MKERWIGRRGCVIAVSGAALAATLCACGHPSVHAVRGVSLLPQPGAPAATWKWTAACNLGPATAHGCRSSGPNIGPIQLNADNWNLGNAPKSTGSVDMSLPVPGRLHVQGNFSAASPCVASTCLSPNATTWVRGYPSVLYGLNQCSAPTSAPVSPALELPMKVSSIPSDLIGTTTYSAWTPQSTYDIAYDLWLNNSDTKTPCQTDGTLEVMIWTDYNERALLPAAETTGTASIPFKVGGTTHSGHSDWTMYANNVFQGGKTQPWGGTVWLVLNQADRVPHGTVSVDISAALSDVGTLLEKNYGWSNFANNYWLDTIPFGLEYGPQNASSTGAGSSYFTLNLSSFCLDVGISLGQAACAAQ